MKARLQFSKVGSMRFIGHLDVMRYFQKAFRRAGIAVAYSQGYSPHQLLSFTSPLGIGLSSDAEYLDMELTESDDAEMMIDRINGQMNEEIRIKKFTLLPDEAKPSMSTLVACDYMICLKPDKAEKKSEMEKLQKTLNDFLAQDTITIMKKTKRSEKEVDIRPNIYHAALTKEAFEQMTKQSYGTLSLDTEEYTPVLFVQLTAGSMLNIKPELVMEALCRFADVEYSPFDFQIHRLEMYGDANRVKGELHTYSTEPKCELVPLSKYEI